MEIKDFFAKMQEVGIAGYIYEENGEDYSHSGVIERHRYDSAYVAFMLYDRKVNGRTMRPFFSYDMKIMAESSAKFYYSDITDWKKEGDIFLFTHVRYGEIRIFPVK